MMSTFQLANLFKGDTKQRPAVTPESLAFMSLPYQYAGAECLIPTKYQGPGTLGDDASFTIPTVSDIFFLALKLGRLEVVIGEVAGLRAPGVDVQVAGAES